MKKKKVLIVNAVPTNNGDAALIMSIYNRLKKENYEVEIETYDYELVKTLYPDVKFVRSIFDNRIIRKLGRLNKIIIPLLLVLRKKDYLSADIIIGAPGGYINSYYGFFNKIYMMYILKKKFNKKIVMYSQSVGPLNEKDVKILSKYINAFDMFMVRDDISYRNIKDLINESNLMQTNDAAFMLPIINRENNESKKVAISVRGWKHDSRNKNKYFKMISKMVEKCVNDGYEVEFISTCQGLENYIDDSNVAKEIYNILSDDIKEKVIINSSYLSLDELREYLTNFKFTIGTRLHMCILSIMSGIPALNISYEVKGKECYKYLGMSEYTIDYNEEIETALLSLDSMIKNIHKNTEYVNVTNKKMNELSELYFSKLISILN